LGLSEVANTLDSRYNLRQAIQHVHLIALQLYYVALYSSIYDSNNTKGTECTENNKSNENIENSTTNNKYTLTNRLHAHNVSQDI